MAKENTKKEEFKVSGEKLLAKIEELIKVGNSRDIAIKRNTGKTLIKIPLLVAVAGALLVPVWVAIGAIAALAVRCKIIVEKK